ncbi:DNA repair protein rad18 [Rhodotorula toruloides]|uniref:DNA repair protein rad18 n=1 Tax=Rhodotorula toruloides TaxID=5286 RepID=A0A511KDM3_RHOTO|nr:DNA repair protein rad18 [Rhodotorula toruloides]
MVDKHIRTDSDSDSGESDTESPTKRARFEDEGDEDRDAASTLPRSTPPRDRNAQDGDDDDESDDDAMSDDDDEQKQALDELRQTQREGPSRIAEAGVIKQVTLQNFMCHAHTTVDFGPQVNFLVGVNGSGKSAVLTGITMALGGNAKTTNRGQKGGDLIMEGKPSARVSVTLANKGEDAFMPHIYGGEITVERVLNKTGSGSYKIKNAEGKVVDQKKATLDAILDNFNIQVDNPMTVLTQDQSRQFLASASPKDKYTFFLRGTQLAQLTEEYEQIRANTEQMEAALQRKMEVLPELKDAYRRAKERAKEAQAAIEQQGNLQKLKDQLAWSYVKEVEDRIEFGETKIAEEQSKLLGMEEELKKYQEELASRETNIADLSSAEKEARQEIEDKQPRLDELRDLLKADRDRATKWKTFERQINATVSRLTETIADFDRQIAEEEKKLSRDLEAERRPLREHIARANEEIEKLSIQMVQARQESTELSEQSDQVAPEYDNVKAQIETAQHRDREVFGRIDHTKRTQQNTMLAYGPRIPEVLNAINQEGGWRERPIGPIGRHVKLERPEYARVLESYFGPNLNAFIVTNHEDAAKMRKICNYFKLDHNIPIITQRYDKSFDFSQGEPAPSILTVLRACKIDHPLVLQVLIVSNHIERGALVPTRPDGDNLMRTNPHNVEAAYSADNFQLRNNQGRSSSSVMAPWRGSPRLVNDVSGQIARLNEERATIQQDIQRLEQEKAEMQQQLARLHRQKQEADSKFAAAQKRTLQLNRSIQQWDAQLTEEQPNNIAALQENKRETEAERENALAQYKAGLEAHNANKGDMGAIADEKADLETFIKGREKLLTRMTASLASSSNQTERVHSEISGLKSRIALVDKAKTTSEKRIEQFNEELEATKQMRQERYDMAIEICPRPEVTKPKDAKKLQKEIDQIERALKEREKRQGASIEQILEELEKRRQIAQEAVKSTSEIAALMREKLLKPFFRLAEALSAAYENRVGRWTDFRSHIAQRAKGQFQHHLQQRGFTGKLKFDHDKCRLNIVVQTEDAQEGQQKAKQKDTKSLSGGEKSFSTICFLLTMWEAVGCPLRCLDEFDVFMDAVNRRIAMRMMIETAKTADQTQFILITPQEMSSITWGPEVKVNKLEDPKRSQGALAHGR